MNAYGAGGVTESVQGLGAAEPTGLFFAEQTAESIQAAVKEFETLAHRFLPAACRRNAERFSVARFRKSFSAYVSDAISMSTKHTE